jgi:predicted  nucleic acid-binding Zn-ribbon protein
MTDKNTPAEPKKRTRTVKPPSDFRLAEQLDEKLKTLDARIKHLTDKLADATSDREQLVKTSDPRILKMLELGD